LRHLLSTIASPIKREGIGKKDGGKGHSSYLRGKKRGEKGPLLQTNAAQTGKGGKEKGKKEVFSFCGREKGGGEKETPVLT